MFKGVYVVRNTHYIPGSTAIRLGRLFVARSFSTMRRASRRRSGQPVAEEAGMSGVRGLGWKCLVCALVGLACSPVAGLAAGPSRHGRDLSGHGASLRRGVSGRRGSSVRAAGGSVHRARSRGAHRGTSRSQSRRMRSARKAPRVSKSRFSVVLGSVSLREGPLVIPGSLGEAEQLKAEQEDKLTNPEAVTVREESRMKFSGLGTEQASKVDGEAFSAVIDEPDGGPPRLPEGQSITGYVSANVGQVNLGGGEHGLVQTLAPMAIQGSSGGWSPVDLGLSEVGGVFVPANPLVAVRIPKRLGEGVQVPGAGISVSPVASNDASLAGSEGVVDGTTVFFANTSTDTDTVVKPSTWGFAVDTVLRSVESPQQLSFRVEMPEGASLVEAKDGSEAVEVVKEGVTIARIPAPGARDAAGSVVPVSMSVSGDVLELSVDDSSGVFQYPIEVDPEFTKGTDSGLGLERNWLYHESPSAGFNHGSIWMYRSEIADSSGQQAEVYYRTNGDSKIYELSTGSVIDPDESGIFTTEARVYLELDGSGGYENGSTIASTGNPLHEENQLCAPGGCSPGNGGEHNLVRFADALTGSHGSNRVELTKATVYIAQPK
jgi:hypothetical protein